MQLAPKKVNDATCTHSGLMLLQLIDASRIYELKGNIMKSVNHTALDLLWGAEEIGKAIGRSTRATFDMLDKGELPAKKVNGRWVISRQKLIDFFMEAA
jgi:hypothetical protein